MQERRLVRIEQKGQVTLPAPMLKDLGLKEGDVVEVERTSGGQIVLTPQELIAVRDLDEIGRVLVQQGLSLEDLIESGREMRAHVSKGAHSTSGGTHGS